MIARDDLAATMLTLRAAARRTGEKFISPDYSRGYRAAMGVALSLLKMDAEISSRMKRAERRRS